MARLMRCLAGVEGAVVVIGVTGGFLVALSAALWMIARATGGSGEDEDSRQ
jgi:hypothetical protein